MDASVSGVGVLDKAVTVLAALEAGPRSLPELVAATGLSRPTAHRLAVALEAHGLVRRGDGGRSALGVRRAPAPPARCWCRRTSARARAGGGGGGGARGGWGRRGGWRRPLRPGGGGGAPPWHA